MSFEPVNGRPPRRPLITNPQKATRGFVAVFFISAAVWLASLGFCAWAIYELVTWVTSK